MIYTALIGNPVDHSVSPVLFEWLSKNATNPIEYRHLKINVDSESELKDTFSALKTLHFSGLNVTLPYKLAVSEFLTDTDESAKKISAINTIVFKDNEVIGYNTDWYGIYASIKQKQIGFNLKKGVIFGSGGAARAAIYACLQLGVEVITVIHRTPESTATEALKTQYKDNPAVNFGLYDQVTEYIDTANLIINTTPAGMEHQATTPFDLALISATTRLKDKVFFDCVFNPVQTPLLESFAQNETIVIDGLWMMIYQGLEAFSLWTGRDIKSDFSQETLLDLHALLEKEVSNDH